jgi:hypothetical protein
VLARGQALPGWSIGALAAPDHLDVLHLSFVRTLRAANRSARGDRSLHLAVTQLRAYLAPLDDTPPNGRRD